MRLLLAAHQFLPKHSSGTEVLTYETLLDWFIQGRGIKKRKLKLPASLLVPGAAIMEALFKDPVVTPDEINMIQVPNVADGIDSVSTHFGWRPTAPSSWVPAHWTKAPARR